MQRGLSTPRRTETAPLVLVAHHEPAIRRSLRGYLETAGYKTLEASGGRQAIALLSENVDVALVELHMTDISGVECISQICKQFVDTQVIAISTSGDVREGVTAMKMGAFRYLASPLDREELLIQIQLAARTSNLARENRLLRRVVSCPTASGELVGSSPAMRSVRKQIDAFAQLDSTVLISGAPGTGKTSVAQWIHQNGPRASRPFVAIQCGAAPAELIEIELLGHARGAVAGATCERPGLAEIADGGTLLLEDIDRLSPELQEKLLNLLQARSVGRIGAESVMRIDVRIIATTTQDLVAMCREGEFREDLFFRLNVLSVQLPSLKDRAPDIPALAYELLRRGARRRNTPPPALTDEAVDALQRYVWPGNVRELETALQRAMNSSSGGILRAMDLVISKRAAGTPANEDPDYLGLAGMTLAEIERRAVIETIRSTGGNKAKAARQLEVSEKTIYNKIKQYNLTGKL
ncbi:MAG TPA: sigma-54 dependent transcriptional regulator [Thermoguttaceae bacterium]|nr:sigma-54 dependent transcriptional regulator [Thermoguttaceae bacterium]